MGEPTSKIEVTSGSSSRGITLRTGRSTRVTLKLPRFFYREEDGEPRDSVDEGELHVVGADGGVEHSFPMRPKGRCPAADSVLQWGQRYKLFVTDEAINDDERAHLARAASEVEIGSRVAVPAPVCFEYHWEIDASDPLSADDVLTLEASDGSYRVREPFDPARHRRGGAVCYRFYGVQPGVRYTLIWDTGEEKIEIFKEQELEL